MSALVNTPLFGVAATLLAWSAARWIQARTRQAWLHPVLVAVALLVALLALGRIPWESYARGGDLVGFLLGPSVVALGVALHLQLRTIAKMGKALLVSLGAGAIVGVLSAAGIARLLGAPREIVASVAPKSVTTPIAIAIAERSGGVPAITAVLVIAVGGLGAVVGPPFLRWIGVKSASAFGVAMGAAAHGLGTARAMEEGELEGASAALAIGLFGVATAVVTPAVLWLLYRP